MDGQSGAEAKPGSIDRPSENVRPFYDYILGRQPYDKEINPAYYLIEADVPQVYRRVNEYIRENPGASVKVIMLQEGLKDVDDLLIACDPDNDLFFVSSDSDRD